MDLRQFLFKNRSYTPIPLLIAILVLADPGLMSLGAGFVMTFLGECIRIWGIRHAGGATRTTGTPGAGAELITHGPFAYVRNPLYLGNFLLSLGLCIMSWAWMPWMLLVFFGLFAFQYGMIVALEEEQLLHRFHEIYEQYLAAVPRFLPRLMPYTKRNVEVMPVGRALKIERNTLMSVSAVTIVIIVIWFSKSAM